VDVGDVEPGVWPRNPPYGPVVVVLPGGRDVLVVQMYGAIRLGENVRAMRMPAAHGDEAAAGLCAPSLRAAAGSSLLQLRKITPPPKDL
jgi:hypothetical protein